MIIDQPCETFAFTDNNLKEVVGLFWVKVRRIDQNLGEGPDRCQWGSEFMTDHCQEFILEPVQFLEPFIGRAQLGGGFFKLAGLGFKTLGILDDVRCFFKNLKYFIKADHLPLATDDTMTRADAAPMDPASRRSVKAIMSASASPLPRHDGSMLRSNWRKD